MAADRDNPKVSHLCQPLAPPVLRLLASDRANMSRHQQAVDAVRRNGWSTSIVRAAAGDGAAQLQHESRIHSLDEGPGIASNDRAG